MGVGDCPVLGLSVKAILVQAILAVHVSWVASHTHHVFTAQVMCCSDPWHSRHRHAVRPEELALGL
jgi:hypothetical protein